MSQLKRLKEQKEAVTAKLVELKDSLEEGQAFTEDQVKAWDGFSAELAEVDSAIATKERLLSLDTGGDEGGGNNGPRFLSIRTKPKADPEMALRGWALAQQGNRQLMTAEMTQAIEAGEVNLSGPINAPVRWNQEAGVEETGGHTINDAVVAGVVKRMKDFGGMLSACRVFNTTDGAPLKKPILDSTNFKGAKTAELGPITNSTQTIAKATFQATELTSGIYEISHQLIRDSSFEFLDEMQAAVGESLGRISNELLTTGSATDEPQGINGAVTAISQTSLSHNNILELFHSVDASYRRSMKCGWMMNDTTVKTVKQTLKDADGRPLYKADPNFVGGYGYQMEGKPVWINTDLPNNVILFGDFDRYHIRLVGGVTIKTLNELFALKNAVGIIGHTAIDGRLVDTTAIKKMVIA